MAETAIRPMPAAQRRLTVAQVMGTAISIDVRDEAISEDLVQRVFAWLVEVDHRFSTYRSDSDVTRLGRGELTLDDCHRDVTAVLSLCEDLRARTGGAFNAWRSRSDGRLDPSGVVKGWAVQCAADILTESGARNFAINAGGDVIARGFPEAGRRWRVGIRHPFTGTAVATVVAISDMAVATSGSYERGNHILDGRTGEPATGLISLTVIGPSMTWADAYATAGFAMGEKGIAWVTNQPGYSVYGITTDGRVRYDDAFARFVDFEDVKSQENRAVSQEGVRRQTWSGANPDDGRRLRGAQG